MLRWILPLAFAFSSVSFAASNMKPVNGFFRPSVRTNLVKKTESSTKMKGTCTDFSGVWKQTSCIRDGQPSNAFDQVMDTRQQDCGYINIVNSWMGMRNLFEVWVDADYNRTYSDSSIQVDNPSAVMNRATFSTDGTKLSMRQTDVSHIFGSLLSDHVVDEWSLQDGVLTVKSDWKHANSDSGAQIVHEECTWTNQAAR